MSRSDLDELIQAMTDETVRGERLAHGLLLVLAVAMSLVVVW